ncbi:hypothetical protein Leryth_012807 [Lithospermum erythrorhizon]|nr:hypothetical protein Leryth_012807 [Lithospermum erythrorhizon]
MNCLSLLLGRLNVKQFETAVAEYGSQLSELLMSQLRSSDEQVVDSTILILKAVIFKTKDGSVKSSLLDSKQMDAALTMLLPLLDELDGSARAVVKLVAEYCSIYADSRCMEEVLKRLSSENVSQRKNAADVISDVINRSFETTNIPHAVWQDLANRLLLCLGDGESVIRSQASTLLPLIDPSLVLPELVLLVYSQDESVELYASRTFKAVMRNHKHSPEVICTLLDCLSTLCQNSDLNATGSKGEGAKLDIDKILKLLSDWTLLVEDWNSLVDPLMDKIFSEPSNAVIVRFFSHISEYLADASHLVFNRILLYTREQKRSSKDFSGCEASVFRNDDIALFSSLCPLLIIRLLPLRVFDDLNSPAMYGQLLTRKTTFDIGYLGNDGPQSVAALLLNKMLNNSEFEDVRKLAAELCGRIHPNILVPIISHKLKDATNERDLLKIKACLFALCTSFMIRGKDSFLRKDILRIRSSIETVLSWPSTGGDDVSKAQHGCIDCVAWMVCAEVEFSIPSKTATLDTTCNSDAGDSAKKWSVCTYVIENLTQDRCPTTSEGITSKSEVSIHLSFRLCMANILISACQKISNSGGMKVLARKAVPRIIQSVEDILDSEIKAACIQVLFSMVYHLKSEILQYSSDLLTVAMSSLRDGSHKEKLVGAKLLASLMASEEEVVGSIAGGLLEARETLASISLSDSSQDVREVCQKLLMCMTF